METGSIILFKEDKGYGFIRPKDGGDNVYVHVSALQAVGLEALVPGQRVSFDRHEEAGKVSAVNIAILE